MKTLKTLLAGVLIGGLGYHYGIEKSKNLAVKTYAVNHVAIEDPFKVVLLTDLHSNLVGKDQEELIHLVVAQQPSIILLGGDIVDEDLPIENAQQFLRKVAKVAPTYYVTGNHEFYRQNTDDVKAMVRGFGIEVLEGDRVERDFGQTKVNIFGIDDQTTIEAERQISNFAKVSKDSKAFNILLAHRPEVFEKYLEAYPFDLILSGHAHGGQWRIPKILNGLYAPGQGLFPQYAGGEYDLGPAKLIVSRGLDTQKSRIPRIFNQPEIVVINVMGVE